MKTKDEALELKKCPFGKQYIDDVNISIDVVGHLQPVSSPTLDDILSAINDAFYPKDGRSGMMYLTKTHSEH